MGRAIRRLVSLYESLDDLLQAADDHSDEDSEDDDEDEVLTEEALEKQQEYVSTYLLDSLLSTSSGFSDRKVNSMPLKSSYRFFHQWERP